MDNSKPLFMFPRSVAQQIIVELNKLIKSQNEIQNLISLEKIIEILGDYIPSEFKTQNFEPVLIKLETMKAIIDEKPQSVQIEFNKIRNIVSGKPIKKSPYVVVLEDPGLKKEKEMKQLKEILDFLKKVEKEKDEMITKKMRLLSNEKEKIRVERMKETQLQSLKKFLKEKVNRPRYSSVLSRKQDKKINIKKEIERK